jgi:hypothetical protein
VHNDDPRHGTRTRYVNRGCRCRACTDANTREHKRYLLGYCPRLIDPTGTRRRVQALIALGWTYAEISEACGRETKQWAHYVTTTPGRVREDVAADVATAYERMSAVVPDGPYRARARNLARRKGWLPPLAWDDIDNDPEPTPVKRRPGRQEVLPQILEDFDWLTSAGESPEKAAERVGVTLATIRDYRLRAARREMERAS